MYEYAASESYREITEVYENIIKLVSSNSVKISHMSYSTGERILKRLKSSVVDLFSVTSLHFLYAKTEGITHLVFLINKIIDNINCSSLPSSKSWFWQLRDICILYNLPHPLDFLELKYSKTTFKKLTKLAVITYYTYC